MADGLVDVGTAAVGTAFGRCGIAGFAGGRMAADAAAAIADDNDPPPERPIPCLALSPIFRGSPQNKKNPPWFALARVQTTDFSIPRGQANRVLQRWARLHRLTPTGCNGTDAIILCVASPLPAQDGHFVPHCFSQCIKEEDLTAEPRSPPL